MRRRSNSEFGMFDEDDDDYDHDDRRKKEEKPFDPSNREDRRDFDNPSDSIMSRRQGRATRLGGIGALGGLSIWTDAMDLDDDEDDDNLGRLLHARGSPPRSAGANATLEELEEARGKDGDARGARARGKQREGKGKESWGKGWTQAVSGMTADLRNGGTLPDGLEVVGGDPTFEEQEDGAQALMMCEGSYMKVTLPNVTPWSLEDDGRLHRFSLMVAMRCARSRLPPARHLLACEPGATQRASSLRTAHTYLHRPYPHDLSPSATHPSSISLSLSLPQDRPAAYGHAAHFQRLRSPRGRRAHRVRAGVQEWRRRRPRPDGLAGRGRAR